MPLLRRMRRRCSLVLALAFACSYARLPAALRLRHADRSGRDLSCHRRLGGRHQTAGRVPARGFHGWMRYVSFFDLLQLFHAALLASLAVWVVDRTLLTAQVSSSILVLDFITTIFVVGGLPAPAASRASCSGLCWTPICSIATGAGCCWSAPTEQGWCWPTRSTFTPGSMRVVGFLEEDGSAHGSYLGGILIAGGTGRSRHAGAALLGPGGAGPGRQPDRRPTAGSAAQLPAARRWRQGHHQRLRPGRGQRSPRRCPRRPDADVDINDLLRREPVELDRPCGPCCTIGWSW